MHSNFLPAGRFLGGLALLLLLWMAGTPAANAQVIYQPNTNFTIGSTTGVNGFNGAVNSSDNTTLTGTPLVCPPGDKALLTLTLSSTTVCPGDFVPATLSINNLSGFTLNNARLTLNLTGTQAQFNGEPYNISNALALATPNLLDPAYPNVPNALATKTGSQTLAVFSLPPGISTLNIDIRQGTTLTSLTATLGQLPATVNATGTSSGTAAANAGLVPAISGSCPPDVTIAATSLALPWSVTNAASVRWTSGSNGVFSNSATASTTYTINDIDRANGFVDLAMTALSVNGCDNTLTCRVLITGATYDYGDAPISYDFGSNTIPIAAAATLSPAIYLGVLPPNAESTALNSVSATADAQDDGLTSTGIVRPTPGQNGYTLPIRVTNTSAAPAYVYGYMDWNNDGDFNADPDERSLMLTVPAGSGTSTRSLTFAVPASLSASLTNPILRLRISSDDIAVGSPNGAAANGEVEDYRVQLLAASGSIDCAKTQLTPAPVSGTAAQLGLVVSLSVTTPGTFLPLTVSGSGMSLANGITQVSLTGTGLQQVYLPLQYDGSPLGTLTFTIGQAGSCSANLTTPPKKVINDVWTLGCVPTAAPGLK
jgi:hypothetical protein